MIEINHLPLPSLETGGGAESFKPLVTGLVFLACPAPPLKLPRGPQESFQHKLSWLWIAQELSYCSGPFKGIWNSVSGAGTKDQIYSLLYNRPQEYIWFSRIALSKWNIINFILQRRHLALKTYVIGTRSHK